MPLCQTTKGWDPVTGFGTPNFGRLKEIVTGHLGLLSGDVHENSFEELVQDWNVFDRPEGARVGQHHLTLSLASISIFFLLLQYPDSWLAIFIFSCIDHSRGRDDHSGVNGITVFRIGNSSAGQFL